MQSNVSHAVWEQSDSHILFPNPDAGWTQPLGIKLGLWDIWAVFLHLCYHTLYLRWHTNFTEHLFNKYLQKTRFIQFFLNRAYSHNKADCEVAAWQWAGGKDGTSHLRDSKLPMAKRCAGVLPNLLHRPEYRTGHWTAADISTSSCAFAWKAGLLAQHSYAVLRKKRNRRRN